MSLDRQRENYYRVARTLSVCVTEAPYALSERQLFQSICDRLVGLGLFQLAWFGYASCGSRVNQVAGYSGSDPDFVEDLRRALDHESYEEPVSVSIRQGTPYWIRDIAAHPDFAPMQPAIRRSGLTSNISIPLMSDAGTWAGLSLYYSDPEAYEQLVVNYIRERIQHAQRAWSGGPPKQPRSDELDAELRHLIDMIPQTIGVCDAGGTLLYINKAMIDYAGFVVEDFTHRNATVRLTHPDDLKQILLTYAAGFANGQPFALELRQRRRKDQQYRWFLVNVAPIRNESGDIVRWCSLGTDIEERKAAEELLKNENVSLREEVEKVSMFEEIVGASESLQQVILRISRVAPTDSSVLITGETGTGKELVARAIHRRSGRAAGPFVSVNCAAIPPDLIASELFGYEKGAFTGATQRRLGRFELATKGTLFLDEVGELPAEAQIALLRVLQEREFERIGGTAVIPCDVRVIAATNRDLDAAIREGRFRSDLFYRLNVFPIKVPALRDRTEDIPLLVAYFLGRYGRRSGKTFNAVNNRSLELLQAYSWPGNIRELQNVIERSVIVSDSETFSVDEGWLSSQSPAAVPGGPDKLPTTLARQEKEMIELALRACRGRVAGRSGAAAKLGLPASTLDSRIKALGIEKHRFRN